MSRRLRLVAGFAGLLPLASALGILPAHAGVVDPIVVGQTYSGSMGFHSTRCAVDFSAPARFERTNSLAYEYQIAPTVDGSVWGHPGVKTIGGNIRFLVSAATIVGTSGSVVEDLLPGGQSPARVPGTWTQSFSFPSSPPGLVHVTGSFNQTGGCSYTYVADFLPDTLGH